MLAFLIFVGFICHLILAHTASHLLSDLDTEGRWKHKYRKYLLIPGLPEVILVILAFTITGVIAYAYVIDLFKDFKD